MKPKKANLAKRAMSTLPTLSSLVRILLVESSVVVVVVFDVRRDCCMACPDRSAAPKITPAVMLFTRSGSVSSAERYEDHRSSNPAKLFIRVVVVVVGRCRWLSLLIKEEDVHLRRPYVVVVV